jgi:two-component system, OmpR family, response regulator RegX3
MRILLAESDPVALDVTSYALRKRGFDIVGVTDGPSAIARWQKDQPDLVVLDTNLPVLSGVNVCRAIREQSSTPIIMLSALDDEMHVLEAFDGGADDFVTKPLSYRELAMRMRCLLRRVSDGVVQPRTVASAGDLSVDLSNHEVHKSGRLAHLTRLEVRTLFFLLASAGRVVKSEHLIELVWNSVGGDAFSLKTHISRIRHKLGMTRGTPGCITAVPHVGYRLEIA